MDYKTYKDTVYQIIGAAMTVHSELRWGLLEPVYQEALSIELEACEIDNQREKELIVFYKGTELNKKYKMDIVVDDIIIELKSVVKILPVHRAQLCNYLRLTRKPIGLLINFGESQLMGERWAFDEKTNECFLIDRNMDRVYEEGSDYESLLSTEVKEKTKEKLKSN